MSELKISDFKMFERAPHKLPEPRAFTELGLAAVKEEEKTYGAVFTTRLRPGAFYLLYTITKLV